MRIYIYVYMYFISTLSDSTLSPNNECGVPVHFFKIQGATYTCIVLCLPKRNFYGLKRGNSVDCRQTH